jgi:peptidoglycan/LPS O-acetylase OafA/YrhL
MGKNRFAVLDGWRGISILAVLACHLLPLGPKAWALNKSAGLFGMAIFFTLSGFLITRFLLEGATVRDFLIRRLCRIVPLAWLGLLVGLPMAHATPQQYLPNFLFFANYAPSNWLTAVTAHYWSLCVEVQFYAAAAMLYGFCGRRGLLVGLPIGAAAVTAWRIHVGAHDSVVTYARVDEILSGGLLAMVYAGRFGGKARAAIGALPPLLMLALFTASSLVLGGPIEYARPYLAALLVGSTLIGTPAAFGGVLRTKPLAYIAEISYALYIIHPLAADTWLGSGGKLVKYAKRPLLITATFALAHVSTRYYERRWIEWGKRLSSLSASVEAPPARARQLPG